MKRTIILALLLLAFLAPAWGQVVISEIMANPGAVGDTEGEWLELCNAGPETVDLNGWTLSDLGTNEHLIDAGGPLLLQAGQYMVLAREDDWELNGHVNAAYEYSGFQLANGDDEVVLLDATGEEVDAVYYNDQDFPDPNGASFYLRDLDADNTVGSNWSSSHYRWPGSAGDRGSPGAANPLPSAEPVNPGFESWTDESPDGWYTDFDPGNTLYPELEETHSGVRSLEIEWHHDTPQKVHQEVLAEENQAYSFRFWTFNPGFFGEARPRITFLDSRCKAVLGGVEGQDRFTGEPSSLYDAWEELTVQGLAPEGTVFARITLILDRESGWTIPAHQFVDDVSWQQGTNQVGGGHGNPPGEGFLLHPFHPNPTNDMASCAITVLRPAMVEITMVNLLGRTVFREHLGFLADGRHTYALPLHNLPSGSYIVQLRSGEGQVSTRRLLVLR